jgi:hypothetical protein
MIALTEWGNFYVIVGSSAGALIGLQFVVMTLIADVPLGRGDAQASNAFTTPSVIHFGVALLLSALVTVPWSGIGPIAILWGVLGVGGIIYTLIVSRRLRTQTIYRPVFEDWLFHALLPLAAYAALAASAGAACCHARPALFLVAAAALLLLFIGIDNAWDTVTYHVFVRKHKQGESEPTTKPKE